MTGLEDLLLVLTLEGHPVVDILVTHLDAVDGLVLAHRVDVLRHHVGLGLLLHATLRLHHVRNLFDVVGADKHRLERLHLVARDGSAQGIVLSDLVRCQASSVLEHLNLHIGETELLERFHYGQLKLSHIEVAFHLLVLVVAHSIQICFESFLELEVGDFGVPVLHLSSQHHHGVVRCASLLFLFVVIVRGTGPFSMLLVECFPRSNLQRFLKEVIMVHELKELEVVSVGLPHPLSSVGHLSEENLSLKVGHHQHLEVISLDLANGLIRTENTLLLNLFR